MKEEGNTFFKEGKYEEALSCYTKVGGHTNKKAISNNPETVM